MAKNKADMPRVIRLRVEVDTIDAEGKVETHTPVDWRESEETEIHLVYSSGVSLKGATVQLTGEFKDK